MVCLYTDLRTLQYPLSVIAFSIVLRFKSRDKRITRGMVDYGMEKCIAIDREKKKTRSRPLSFYGGLGCPSYNEPRMHFDVLKCRRKCRAIVVVLLTMASHQDGRSRTRLGMKGSGQSLKFNVVVEIYKIFMKSVDRNTNV